MAVAPEGPRVNKAPRVSKPRSEKKIMADRAAKDAETLSLCRQYGWYIDRAFDFRKRELEKQIENAKKAQEEPHGPLQDDIYKSLASMISEAEYIQREFNTAHEALRAAGIK